MNEIIVNSKKSLLKTTEDLLKTTEQYRNKIESDATVLKSITNYGIDLASAGKILANNFENIFTDCYNVSKTANNYINNLINLDIDDFNLSNNVLLDSSKEIYTSYTGPSSSNSYVSSNNSSSNTSTGSSNNTTYPTTGPTVDENIIQTAEGTEIYLPSGLGSVRTYMGWQCITSKTSTQYKLMQTAGVNFDEEGFGKIGDRYVVATTTTYGKVGDFIDVYQADGTILKCIIGDIKNQNDPGCNKWGHNNGKCVIESIVDKNTWYKNGAGNHANPGTPTCHPEWKQNIIKIVNKGNYFDYIKNNNTKDIVNV